MREGILHPALVLFEASKGSNMFVFAGHNKTFNPRSYFKLTENSNTALDPFGRDVFFLVKERDVTRNFLWWTYQAKKHDVCASVTFSKLLQYADDPKKLSVRVEICGKENEKVFIESVLPKLKEAFGSVTYMVTSLAEQAGWNEASLRPVAY